MSLVHYVSFPPCSLTPSFQAAEGLHLNADLLDHTIVAGFGKFFSNKGIKDKLKTLKVTNSHALVPQVIHLQQITCSSLLFIVNFSF